MGIIGHGVDLLNVTRMAALVQRRGQNKVAKRILSKTEFLEWETLTRGHLKFLAVR